VRKIPVLLIAAVLSGSLLLSACGGSAGATGTTKPGATSSTSSPGSESTTPNPQSSTSTTFPYGNSHVVGKPTASTSVPKEGQVTVPQYVGDGQQVLIEPGGFWPQTLYANMAVAVIWTNETSVPQKVVLDDIPVHSAEIPPGGQFVWSPHFGGSYTYHSASGLHARLILQQDIPVSLPPTTATTSH
jgi:hypothetical protein